MPTYSISGGAVAATTVMGQLPVSLAPANDPEGRYRAFGFRPGLPLIVYSMAIDGLYPGSYGSGSGSCSGRVLPTIPANGSFVVPTSYVPHAGDGIYELGAASGSIGLLWIQSGYPINVIFRPPNPYEVVWFVNLNATPPDQGLFRWEGGQWKPYVTMLQRALRGMHAFEVADPDQVYDYWGRLVGAVQVMMTGDSASILNFIDPERCPIDYLGLLGYELGNPTIEAGDNSILLREEVVETVPINRIRTTTQSVKTLLGLLGYQGYANEVWVNPTDVTGADYIEVPHLPTVRPSAPYVPSSRVSIHLNNLDGSPLSAGLSSDTLLDIKRTVTQALVATVLPAHVSVRFFATDTAPNVYRYF